MPQHATIEVDELARDVVRHECTATPGSEAAKLSTPHDASMLAHEHLRNAVLMHLISMIVDLRLDSLRHAARPPPAPDPAWSVRCGGSCATERFALARSANGAPSG